MRYTGGKHRQGKVISKFINEALSELPDAWYVEPFCGALGVAHRVKARKMILADNHQALIAMWRAILQERVELPDDIPRSVYEEMKTGPVDQSDWMTGYVGFGMSLYGRFLNAFRDGTAPTLKRSVEKKRVALDNVDQLYILQSDYRDLELPPAPAVIYLDPPYRGKYHYGNPNFDHDVFWNWADNLADDGHVVFATEFTVPAHWEVLHNWGNTTALAPDTVRDRSGSEVLVARHGLT